MAATGASLLVIGGSGFFGKSILDAFRRGLLTPWNVARVIVFARTPGTLARDCPELLGDRVELVSGDIGTATALPAANYVIHAASSSDARRYADFPREERANILQAVDTYAALAADVHRGSRILYTSSGAVYGQQPAEVARIDEDFVPRAATELVAYKRDYAEAKRLAEARIADLGQQGLHVSVARCFAFVGAYLPRDQHFAIGNFLADGMAGRAVRVGARHRVYRSYMHADDLVVWLMTIMDQGAPGCPVYNVGSDEAVTMGEAAQAVAAKFAVPAQVPAITSDVVDRYVPSVDKAGRELGLRCRYDLDAALDDVIGRIGQDDTARRTALV